MIITSAIRLSYEDPYFSGNLLLLKKMQLHLKNY